jgi:hypothetical protein
MKTISKDLLIRGIISVGMVLAIIGGYIAYSVNQ